MGDTLFGYAIPMPKSDLFVALASIAALFPCVIAAHWLVTTLLVCSKPKRA